MSSDWPNRVVFLDKSGRVVLFPPQSAIRHWQPDPTANILHPVQGCISPVISFLPSGLWCIWDVSPFAETNRGARILTEHEAVSCILEWGLDPGEHGVSALGAMDISAKREAPYQLARMVYDPASQSSIHFDPTGCEIFGPITDEEGWLPLDGCPEYYIQEVLYRFPTGHWVKIQDRNHVEAPRSCGEELIRMTDEEASHWLLDHGFEIPADLRCFVESRIFDPMKPPSPPVRPSGPVPTWDAENNQLFFRGKRVRSVRHNATNVRKILDAFQEDGWPQKIDSPWSDDEKGAETRREAIDSLNTGLAVLRFSADGTKSGICWSAEESASEFTDVPF